MFLRVCFFSIALPVGHPAGYKARLFWPVFLKCSEGGRAFSFACVVSNKSPAGIVKKALAGGGGEKSSYCHGGRRRREIGLSLQPHFFSRPSTVRSIIGGGASKGGPMDESNGMGFDNHTLELIEQLGLQRREMSEDLLLEEGCKTANPSSSSSSFPILSRVIIPAAPFLFCRRHTRNRERKASALFFPLHGRA